MSHLVVITVRTGMEDLNVLQEWRIIESAIDPAAQLLHSSYAPENVHGKNVDK